MADTFCITGAGRGLGLALSHEVLNRGEVLFGTVRDPDSVPEIARLAHRLFSLDASDAKSIAALAEQAGDRPIDVLINNAGVSSRGKSLETLDADDLQRVMMINAIAPMLVVKALLPNLRSGRRRLIVNISSQLGSIGNNSGGSSYAYRASKAALNMLTVSLANELGDEGFTCIAVHPGWVRTNMGGEQAPISPEQSARSLHDLIDVLSPAHNGTFINHEGRPLPW